MSAPVTERGRTAVRGRTGAVPAQRGYAGGAVGGAVASPAAVPTADPVVGRRTAQQKAYARREERAGARVARTAAPVGRPQFVLLIMVLLAVGLVATLWLSTAAAADSYRLQDASAEARVLSEQVERLTQEVAVLASAPELARRAGELGMVPVRDPARLVVAANGSVDVIGQPRAAVPPPPPAPPAPPAPSGPEGAAPGNTPPESTPTGEAAQDGTAQLAAPDSEEAGAPEVDGGESGRDPAGNAAAQGATGEDAAAGTGTRAGGDRTDAG
ncbi:cell division protein FtsL [Pseudonocardia hierapolitana]|uniref:Cell division protein FtsL n=1 Tax=Pseudonocardia hierapolitana TaxID=1128676 RepID=A0A561T5X7_9PSEU|nr:hypothetical protein [Pseudonocardia hierapolitana]TWF82513.1 cell division protein FtsL [Pseudonocardia hierapolitana]